MKPPKLDALMGLRFFAAAIVVLHHYLYMVPGYNALAPQWLTNMLNAGASSVSLFFVLSGFVLAYNYLQPDGELAGNRREYFVARFARIYPIYLLGMVVYLPIALARYFSGTGLSVVDVGPGATFAVSGILTLLMLQAWTAVFTAWNGPCWSVSAEVFFYSIFPWAGPRLMKCGRRSLFITMGALWAISLMAPAYYSIAFAGRAPKQVTDLWEVTLAFFPLFRIYPFLIGIGAGIYFRRRPSEPTFRTAPVAILLLAVILIASALTPVIYDRLLDNTFTPLFALLVYCLAFRDGALVRVLSHPKIVLLGETSYAMYLLHNPLWNYMARLQNIGMIVFHRHFPVGLAKPGVPTDWNYAMTPWMFVLYVLVLVGVSIATLLYIERPARTYLKRRFSAPRPAGQPRTDIARPEAEAM